MMLFPLDGCLKLAVLDPENAFHPPVDCKPEFCPAGMELCLGVTGAKHKQTPWLSMPCPVQEVCVATVVEVP